MPTLVTGAAGFAGSHLLDLLARDPNDLVAWNRPGERPGAETASTRWQTVDLLDRAAVHRTIAALRPDVVYHCAGAAHVGSSWSHSESTFAVNVRGTHHLIDALRRARVRAKVVMVSSAMVYRPADEALTEEHPLVPSSPYGLSKLAQELLGVHALDDGLAVMIARSFNHFGPRQAEAFVASRSARQIAEIEARRREPEIAVGNLRARRDLTDVRDTVRAYKALLEGGSPGRPYNVCTGRALSIRDLLDLLIARANVPVRVRVDPARYQPNDLPLVLGDPARIREEIGWTPVIPIERTADDLLEYWRKLEGSRQNSFLP